MALFLIIIIVGAIVFYKQTAGSENAKLVKSLTRGKNPQQAAVITYFKRQGCMAKTITDDEFLNMVSSMRNQYNSKQQALSRIGLDEDEVKEIAPVYFEGFDFDHSNYEKRTVSGKWVCSTYETTWLFFSDSQVHVYKCRFSLDEDKKTEITDEYFYKDITAFTTLTQEIQKGSDRIPSVAFLMKGAGIDFACSVTESPDFENSVRGMKQKLREKKNA